MILKVEGPFDTKVEAERAKEHASEEVRMRQNCGAKEYFVVREIDLNTRPTPGKVVRA